MKKLIYIISVVMLLTFASEANARSCFDDVPDFTDCNVKVEQGNAGVQFILGWMYEEGEGVPEDYKKAVYWYSKVAEQGSALAQNNLGVMYALGNGVLQDYVMAHMFWNIAGENGNKAGTAE